VTNDTKPERVRAGGGFITAKNTSYSMKGLVLLSSGGQFCYAYDKMSDLVGSEIWKTCTYAKQFGCCPSNLTVRPRRVTILLLLLFGLRSIRSLWRW